VRLARWSASSGFFDEETHGPNYILSVPTIVITPPRSPKVGVNNHTETRLLTPERNPFYLLPPPYPGLPPHHHTQVLRRRSPEHQQHRGSRWLTLLPVVFLLLLISGSLHGLHSIHSSETRTPDDLAGGLARQEADEGGSRLSSASDYHDFLEWLAALAAPLRRRR